MLLLDYQNVLIQSLLTERFTSATPAPVDQTVFDFAGVSFHIANPSGDPTKIRVSMQIRCWNDLVQYGATELLQREYGSYIVEPEANYNFSIMVDLENLPESKEERDALAMSFALLKRNAMAAPFEHAYQSHYKLKETASKYDPENAPRGVKEGDAFRIIHYREEESIYIQATHDRVTVIFSTVFREESDRLLGETLMKEFYEVRKTGSRNAPQVLYSQGPPLELQGVEGVDSSHDIGYVTFVIERNLTPQHMPEYISHIQTFRDYFHYHIKASKAYMNTRMRKRTADFLQVLRRARPEAEEKERKTASGRTFKVQGA